MKNIFILIIVGMISFSCGDDKIIVKGGGNNVSKREVILSQEIDKDSTTHITTQIIWYNNEILDKSITMVKTKNLPSVIDTVDYQSGKKKIISKQQKYPIYISIK